MTEGTELSDNGQMSAEPALPEDRLPYLKPRLCRYCKRAIPKHIFGNYCSAAHFIADKKKALARAGGQPVGLGGFAGVPIAPGYSPKFLFLLMLGVFASMFFVITGGNVAKLFVGKDDTPMFATPPPGAVRPTPPPMPTQTREKYNLRIQKTLGAEPWYDDVRDLLRKELGREPDAMEVLRNAYRANEAQGTPPPPTK